MLTYCIHKLIQTEPGADQIFSLNSSYCYNFTLWGCFITLLYNFRMWNSCSRKGQRAALASTPMKKQPGLQSWKLLLYQVLDRVAVTSPMFFEEFWPWRGGWGINWDGHRMRCWERLGVVSCWPERLQLPTFGSNPLAFLYPGFLSVLRPAYSIVMCVNFFWTSSSAKRHPVTSTSATLHSLGPLSTQSVPCLYHRHMEPPALVRGLHLHLPIVHRVQ